MSQTIAIGPLAVPVAFLVFAASVGLGWFVAGRAARGKALDIEPQLYVVLAAGLLAARAAFVLQYRATYLDAPLSVLDIRDGGWRPGIGLLAAGAAALLLSLWRRSLAKPLVLGLATTVSAWLVATLALVNLGSGPTQTQLPRLTLSGLEGQPVALHQFSGRPVVVNLWATWCPPCIREMPVLQQAQQARGDVHFVFVNQGEPASRVASFLQARGLPLRNVLLDPTSQSAVQFGQRGLPTTLFFDAQGRLVDTRVGELSAATLAQRLDRLTQAPRRALP